MREELGEPDQVQGPREVEGEELQEMRQRVIWAWGLRTWPGLGVCLEARREGPEAQAGVWELQSSGEQGRQIQLGEQEEEREEPPSLEWGEQLLRALEGEPEVQEEECWEC